jgi:transmembrane serine protease 3
MTKLVVFAILLAISIGESVNGNCDFAKYPNYRFSGQRQAIVSASSENDCARFCWQYNKDGRTCKSANFYANQQKCDMMQDDAWQSAAGSRSDEDKSSLYVGQIDCSTSTGPGSQPQPAPGPEPKNTLPRGSCGQTAIPIRATRKHNRIVGGNEAIKHSIPWIVSLRGDYGHHCGGTLIRVRPDKDESDIVVTAAHCMERIRRPFNVVAGAHYKSQAEPGEKSVLVVRDISHPEYGRPQAFANDITILKLNHSIKFNDHIQPACLPDANEIATDGTNGIVAGWGYTASDNSGEWPDKLMNVAVPVMGTEQCKQFYGLVPEAMLCAGLVAGGKDSCQGDSGGPYVTKGRKGYTLHGVVSFGNGCALANAPGVYAKVTNYLNWIQEQIRTYSDVYRS